MASADLPQENEGRFSKLKRAVKKGFRKTIPIAISWAAGAIFPPAGAALYAFLKEKINSNEIPIKIDDEDLKEACTGNDSIEALQEKLKKILSEKRGLTKEQLEMALSTFLRPLNEAVNDVMEYIKKYPEQLTYLMDEWKAENKELITQLSINIESGFDDIKTSLSMQTNKIDLIVRKLTMFERLLDRNFANNAKNIFSSGKISFDNLKLLSKAQISGIYYNIRSPYDIAFDPDLFVKREYADFVFEDFLMDLTSPYNTKFLFLVLAGAGMGKTWTLTSWVKRLSEGGFDIPGTEKLIPFFLPLRLDFELQLKVLTGTNNIIEAIEQLKIINETTDAIPILFLDGLDEIRPDLAKKVLNEIIDLVNIQVPVILTCRDTDWTREEKIIDVQSSLRDYCYEHNIGSANNIEDIVCPPSIYLEKFTEAEFNLALERYKIPESVLKSEQLKEMARYPILMRLFADYYHMNDALPDPSDPKLFSPIFLGLKGSPPETNILGRFGIIGTKRDYLIRLTKIFIEKGSELTTNDLQELILDKENFKIIRSSGLIIIEWNPLGAVFKLNPLYEPHLKYMAQLAGIIITKKEASEEIDEISKIGAPDEKIIAERRKQFDYLIHLGEDALSSKNYQNAMKNFEEAREISEYLADFKLTKQVIEKIKYTENLIEKKRKKIILKSKELLTDKIKIPVSELAEKFKIKPKLLISYLEYNFYFDEDTNTFWLNKEEYNNCKLVSYKGVKIHKFEMEVLKEMEFYYKKEFKVVQNVEKDKEMTFNVQNNYVVGLSLKSCVDDKLLESIGKLKELKVLDLSINRLHNIPDSIGNLKKLEKLDLSYNNFVDLNEAIGQLRSLKELNISSNKIIFLPESFDNLTQLEILNINNNEFYYFTHRDLKNFKALKEISASNNKIGQLCDDIKYLKSLTWFFLDNNNLKELPESIGEMESLEYFYLENNNLKTLPNSILEAPLYSLRIKGNPLNSKGKAIIKKLMKKGVKIEI
ncbi:MAG: leucine-rich repeat domain-containing protein [Promethearchaeia archaeon]